MKLTLAVLGVALAAVSSSVRSEEGCCCHCGNHCPTKKICRLVCEEKTVKKVVWGCKCDAVCLPCKSDRGCLTSECVHCDGEGCDCCSHGACGKIEEFCWQPGGAEIRHIVKLQKFEISRKVPSYKWVVEDVCCNCCAHCGDGAAPPPGEGSPSDAPPPPPRPASSRIQRTSAPSR